AALPVGDGQDELGIELVAARGLAQDSLGVEVRATAADARLCLFGGLRIRGGPHPALPRRRGSDNARRGLGGLRDNRANEVAQVMLRLIRRNGRSTRAA